MPSTPNMNDSLNSLRDRSERTATQCTSREMKLNASFAQPHQVFSTMKNSLTFTLCFALSCLTLSAAPQLSNVVSSSTDAPLGYWLEVEQVAVHDEGELVGQTTYRLAMHMLNDGDFLSSCSGEADNPMILESTSGEWYNHPANLGWNASGINPTVFGSFPELAFDSYLTLGPPRQTATILNILQETWIGPTNLWAPHQRGPASTPQATCLVLRGTTCQT